MNFMHFLPLIKKVTKFKLKAFFFVNLAALNTIESSSFTTSHRLVCSSNHSTTTANQYGPQNLIFDFKLEQTLNCSDLEFLQKC